MTKKEMLFTMDLQGYKQSAPSYESEMMDREVCNECSCQCGQIGLLYYPFIKGGSYRAFAVCPECDNAQEF